MAIQKFIIPPDNSSYSVIDGKEVISIQLEGGAARYRQDIIGATSTVDVSWILGREEYKYLRSFYRGVTGKGAFPFLLNLILDTDEIEEYKCYFIPGSMKLTGQKGITYLVSAQLEVYPKDDTDQGDFAYIYGEFSYNWYYWLNFLNNITNIELPEIL